MPESFSIKYRGNAGQEGYNWFVFSEGKVALKFELSGSAGDRLYGPLSTEHRLIPGFTLNFVAARVEPTIAYLRSLSLAELKYLAGPTGIIDLAGLLEVHGIIDVAPESLLEKLRP